MAETIKIPRLGDRILIEAFDELNAIHALTNTRIDTGVGQFPADILKPEANPNLELLINQNAALISTMTTTVCGAFNVNFYRGGSQQPKSAVFDELYFSYNEGSNPEVPIESRLFILGFLSRRLQAFSPDKVPLGTTSETGEFEAMHKAMLTRLESLAGQVILDASATREELERKHAEKIQAAEDELASKKKQLDEAYQRESKKLAAKSDEYDEKLKVIDDRTNTHARRAIRDKMLDDVKSRIENFGVSPLTARKRHPVLIGISMLGFVLAALLIFTLTELRDYQRSEESAVIVHPHQQTRFELMFGSTTGTTEGSETTSPDTASAARMFFYFLWIRISILSLGLFGTILFYIKWSSKWAEHHVNSEFQLQQFYIDVNRANWVIESGLEWEKETKTKMPESLVSSLTKNLFVSGSEPETVLHPADELASALMGSASKLNVKLGDNELIFDKPGKIAKNVATQKSDAA